MKWIEYCIKIVRFSVLVNEELVGFFASKRGLRQGDPISPFLFILSMEGFDSMMRIAAQKKMDQRVQSWGQCRERDGSWSSVVCR